MIIKVNGKPIGEIDAIERSREAEQAIVCDPEIAPLVEDASIIEFRWAVDGTSLDIVGMQYTPASTTDNITPITELTQ